MFSQKIFKAYDIRGVYPTEINEEAAFKIGSALVKFLKLGKGKSVAVGRDMRTHSHDLFDALAAGITSSGVFVVDIGLCSTDMLYFATANYKYNAGIMITASHNPPQYNGMKFVRENAIPIGEESGLKEIQKLVNEDKQIAEKYQKYLNGEGCNEGNSCACTNITKKNVMDDFVKHVLSFIDAEKLNDEDKNPKFRKLRVLADAGNGMAGLVAPKIFANLKCKLIPMCFELDGNFPDHQPDPLVPENRKKIVARMKKGEADIGIAFDGDVDRCFFIDDKGEFVPGDFITALFAEHFLKKQQKEGNEDKRDAKKKSGDKPTVLYDVRASWAVKNTVEKNKGKAIMMRVGHAFFKQKMREEKAVFGGEVSGHYYFRENFNCDSGIIPALLMIEILSDLGKEGKIARLSELVAKFKDYHVSGEINSVVEDKDEAIERLKKKYGKNKSDVNNCAKTYFIDGISVEYDDWHFNVRKSNTEPLLRLNLEAKSEKMMKEKVEEVLGIIKNRS
ncbi:phosphomannomutase/phosphoglucomutase [Candidatus Woesearchaeota archaeon]|nr:phosphomannomutase/phosphoglucomutase [Candidatus Woesearchaeota archaeon]